MATCEPAKEIHKVITAQNSKPSMLNKGIVQSKNETMEKKIIQNKNEMVLYIIMKYHQLNTDKSNII